MTLDAIARVTPGRAVLMHMDSSMDYATLAAELPGGVEPGYDGLEVAPFTLSDAPDKITSAEASKIRTTIEGHGLVVTGLHWLLVKPDGLSLTDPDPAVRTRTIEVMTRLTGLCAELGGKVLVHCKGGLGRAGLVAARILVERGVPPRAAIDAVRTVRPGAVETAAQERHVLMQPTPP